MIYFFGGKCDVFFKGLMDGEVICYYCMFLLFYVKEGDCVVEVFEVVVKDKVFKLILK